MEKLRIPIPDPLGILGKATEKMPIVLYDPLHDAGEMVEARKGELTVAEKKGGGYVESNIENYTYHLEKALKYAPCPGCRTLVLGALVGVEIYRRMEEQGMKREEFTEAEIEKIKKEVEEKYGG